jgi:peptidyl-tRNA hydrolase, PTH2 family
MARRPAPTGSDYKMVLVVRGELRLTAGKAAVQVAHAAVLLALETEKRSPAAFRAWSATGQKKIAVVAPRLEDLEALARKARGLGIPWVLVEDAGFTEVPPGTKTCLGLGPAPSADVDLVTGELPLL